MEGIERGLVEMLQRGIPERGLDCEDPPRIRIIFEDHCLMDGGVFGQRRNHRSWSTVGSNATHIGGTAG